MWARPPWPKKLADSLGARLVLEQAEANPFLTEFNQDRRQFAFQTQLFFLLSRFRQLQDLAQLDLFQRSTVANYLFEKDRLFALANLTDDEFALYDQVFNLLQDRVPRPDLVVYLSAHSEALKERLKARSQSEPGESDEYLEDLVEAYNRFFFHYDRTPLLVVNTSGADLVGDQDNFKDLLRQIKQHRRGVKHYIPIIRPDDSGRLDI